MTEEMQVVSPKFWPFEWIQTMLPYQSFNEGEGSRSIMKTPLLIVLLFLGASLSGCISESETTPIVEEVQLSCDGPDYPDYLVGCAMENFSLPGDDNSTYNRSSLDEGGRWVGYFSAVWCTHCEPTMKALDDSIPAGRMLIFNKDPRAQYNDMGEWRNRTEEGLNRSITHPFINAPDLAASMNVTSIPYVSLIENGEIIAVRHGLWSNATEMGQWFLADNPNSGVSIQLEGIEI